MKIICILFLLFTLVPPLFGQHPSQQPLQIAWSQDGITFNTPTIFQDSSGVPSAIKWKGDTLICAFQWFRLPNPSPSWDRVAVKFSYDNGFTWTQPTPIVVNGLPSNYQRPFDPTLVHLNGDSVRIYFSSSNGFPSAGLDSSVNTYSAISTDGIHYMFESNARVDEPNNRVIDPAVIYFNHAYHYLSPIGSPQQGAYHYVSPNGIQFMKVPDIPSDNNHNWTGNYMLNDTNELRFYGAGGTGIWFNATSNGGVWNGYTATNLQGGDPSVVKVSALNYFMIYVGSPYATGLNPELVTSEPLSIYPNPAQHVIHIKAGTILLGKAWMIYDNAGNIVLNGTLQAENTSIALGRLPAGVYTFSVHETMTRAFTVLNE